MCCFNDKRREVIAREGAIPIMRDIVLKSLPLQELALPLLLAFAVSSKETRDMVLQQDSNLKGYFHVLATDLNWAANALNSLHELLYNKAKMVEPILAQSSHIETMIQLFSNNPRQRVEVLVSPFVKILAHSSRVAFLCAKDGRLPALFSVWLKDKLGDDVDVRLLRALMGVLGIMFDACVKERVVKAFNATSLHIVRELVRFANNKKLAMHVEAVELQDKMSHHFSDR